MSNLPEAIICDIDGTLAIRGDRDPYDMTRVGEDEPHRLRCWLIHLIHTYGGMPIVFTSGRDNSARFQTSMWLEEHVNIIDYSLVMRAQGDDRPDDVVKKEMLDKIRKVYNPVAAFDDRDKVVKMWRANGVECFQVAEGDF